MKKYLTNRKLAEVFFIITLTSTLILVSYLFFSKKTNDLVVAKINDQKIYKLELERKLKEVMQDRQPNQKVPSLENLPTEVIEILAKEVYIEKEVDERAKKSTFANSQDIKDKVQNYKNQLIRQEFINSITKNEINENKIRDRYIALIEEITGKKEYSISHILVRSKLEADALYKDLRSSKQSTDLFNKLAQKYSIDLSSASSGGRLGYLLETRLTKEMVQAIEHMKKGEISSPVQTKFGWHVIRLDNAREAASLPFETVKEEIKTRLLKEYTEKYYASLIKGAKIKILIKGKKGGSETENQLAVTTNQKEQYQNKEITNNQENKEKIEDIQPQNHIQSKDLVKSKDLPENEIKEKQKEKLSKSKPKQDKREKTILISKDKIKAEAKSNNKKNNISKKNKNKAKNNKTKNKDASKKSSKSSKKQSSETTKNKKSKR